LFYRLISENGLENGCQRAGIYEGWEIAFRPPTTAAD